MKNIVIKFLKCIGRLFGVDLYDREMVFHLEKRFEIEKIDNEKAVTKNLTTMAEERNMATRSLQRSQLEYEGALLREQKLNKEIQKLKINPQTPQLFQDPSFESVSSETKPIRERNVDVKIKFIKKTEAAIAPSKFNYGDAGYDLYCPTDIRIAVEGGDRQVVDTGIVMQIPKGYYGRITTRASVSWRDGISVLGGVIDSSFKNTVKVILINHSREARNFPPGARIAQIVIEKAETVEWVEKKKNITNDERKIGSTGA